MKEYDSYGNPITAESIEQRKRLAKFAQEIWAKREKHLPWNRLAMADLRQRLGQLKEGGSELWQKSGGIRKPRELQYQ